MDVNKFEVLELPNEMLEQEAQGEGHDEPDTKGEVISSGCYPVNITGE